MGETLCRLRGGADRVPTAPAGRDAGAGPAVRYDYGVRRRPGGRPWWQTALLAGVPFGILMGLSAGWRGVGWPWAVADGAVGTVLFGVLMATTLDRLQQRVLTGTGDLTPDELGTALRAARRGPAPAEPRLREAVRTLAQHQHEEQLRARRLGLVVFPVMVVGYLVLALTASPWWWLAAAGALALVVLTVTAPARSRRRLVTLGGPPDPAAG